MPFSYQNQYSDARTNLIVRTSVFSFSVCGADAYANHCPNISNFFSFWDTNRHVFLPLNAVSYSLIPLFVLFLRLIVLPASEERFTRYLAYITVDKVGKVIYN